jgi:uncharacterized membrane protein YhaH (DUF805 family)
MDDIKSAVTTCFNKYVVFNGRADRPEFWYFFLFQVVVLAVLGIVSRPLEMVASLAFLLPGLAVGARRLHDINRSGWWMLIGLIPLIGWLVLIYWGVQPGDAGTNQYGEPPAKKTTTQDLAPGQQ